MFNQTVEQLIEVMLSIVTFVIVEFQSEKEPAAGAEITTSSGKIKLQKLLTTSRM